MNNGVSGQLIYLINSLRRMISFLGNQYKEYIGNIRKQHPKVFDILMAIIQFIWILFSTFFASIVTDLFWILIFVFMTGLLIYITQWAVLTSKAEYEISEIHTDYKKQIKNLASQNYAAVQFVHVLAHKIKDNITGMQHKDIGVVRNDIAELLTETLNTLEDILSNYYKVTVCASIKLCSKPQTLKTYARGQNNINCRGGLSTVTNQNKKSIPVKSNYAYKAIITRQLQYFAEGDLERLQSREDEHEKFYCEYGNWKSLFGASIILPIRCKNMGSRKGGFKILGIICIDTKLPEPQWSKGRDSYAYQITAYFADVIYALIESYMLRQAAEEGKRYT